jgi:branched-chain amino acid transport system substrate-binding protein
MNFKQLALGTAVAVGVGLSGAMTPVAQAEDANYVPLLTYRTGPFAGFRHSHRQRHA